MGTGYVDRQQIEHLACKPLEAQNLSWPKKNPALISPLGTLRTGKWVKPQVVEVAKTENVLNYQKFSTDLNLALSKLYFVDESAPSICRYAFSHSPPTSFFFSRSPFLLPVCAYFP